MASAALIAILAASTYCLVIQYVPEVVFAEFLTWIYNQVRVIAWLPGTWGFVNTLLLVALLGSGAIATRRLVGDGVWIAVGATVIPLAISAIAALIGDGIKATGFGIAAALVLCVAVIKAGLTLSVADGVSTPPGFPLRTLGVYVVGFLPGLALGRAYFADRLVALAGDSGNGWTFTNVSTLWCWMAGALLAFLVAIAVSLIPLGSATGRLPKAIAAIFALVALLVYVGAEAKASANDAAASLTSGSPTDRLSDYCAWWKQGSEPPLTTVLQGSGCATVDVYRGSIRKISNELPYDLSSGTTFAPTDGSIDAYQVVGAAYGDHIVVGALQGNLGGVIYINRETGTVTTADMCPLGTQSIQLRFAGSSTSSENPRNLQITNPGDGAAIFLTCDGAVRRIPM